MSDADLEVLWALDTETLCEWWVLLLQCRWPAELPSPDPQIVRTGKKCRRLQIVDWIRNQVGKKALYSALIRSQA